MKVQIICGTYGYVPNGKTSIKYVSANDVPIEVSETEGERLIKRGVAVEVVRMPAGAVATITEDDDGASAGVNTPNNESPPIPLAAPVEKPAYSPDSKVDSLREIGKAVGIAFRPGTTKLDMVKQLDKFFAAATVDTATPPAQPADDLETKEPDGDDEDSDDDELPPTLSAEDPVP